MVETRIVIVCSQCGAFWDPAVEQASCTDPNHGTTDSNRTSTAAVSCSQIARS